MDTFTEREREREREREIYCKEWAYMIMEAEKCTICSWQAGDPRSP